MNHVRDAADKVLMGAETAGQANGCAEAPIRRAQDECAKRERTWNELGIEDKIARLRDATLQLAVMTERAHHQAGEANSIAKVHDHGSGGQVVVPIDTGANRAMGLLGDIETPFRRIHRLLG
jgi:hypothetical protein